MSDGSAVLLFLRMAVSLAVVLGLIVWAARVVHRRQGGLLGRPQRQVPVTVLARQSLSRHAGLSVVQVGEEVLVLGVTDTEVRLLSTLDPGSVTDPAEDEPQDGHAAPGGGSAADPAPGTPSFADALRQATGLAARRDVKRQATVARKLAEQVPADPDRTGGRHRG